MWGGRAAPRAPVAVLLLLGGADARTLLSKEIDNHSCKVTCQRFGMATLGPKFASTAGDPTACVKVCDEVYPAKDNSALAQVRAAKPATKPAAKEVDNHGCKVTCQRFGMATLGPKFEATAGNPTACVKVCDEVYPASTAGALTQGEAAKPATQLAAKPAAKKVDNHGCKVTCQRFGMATLGPKFKATAGNPTACVKVCDQVYPQSGGVDLRQQDATPKPRNCDKSG